MHVLPYRTSGLNVNYACEDGELIAHHADQIGVEGNITPVTLDSNIPSIEATLPDISITATTHRAFLDKLQIRWFKPSARLWEGSLEFLS